MTTDTTNDTYAICTRATSAYPYPDWPTTPEAKSAALPLYLLHRLFSDLNSCCTRLHNYRHNRKGVAIGTIESVAEQAKYIAYTLAAVDLITNDELTTIRTECRTAALEALNNTRAIRAGRCKADRA